MLNFKYICYDNIVSLCSFLQPPQKTKELLKQTLISGFLNVARLSDTFFFWLSSLKALAKSGLTRVPAQHSLKVRP